MSKFIKCLLLILLLLSTSIIVSCKQYTYDRSILLGDVYKTWSTTIAYKADIKDEWQTAQETLMLKTGDCEDFAIFYAAILINDYGIKPERLRFALYETNAGEQHLTLVLDSDVMMDNWGVHDYDLVYRKNFYLKTTLPIINTRSTSEFYIFK